MPATLDPEKVRLLLALIADVRCHSERSSKR
jgi:hypothetical protein